MAESETVRHLPLGSKVQVYREDEGWTDYLLAKVEEKEVCVFLPSVKISSFSIHNARAIPSDDKDQCIRIAEGKVTSTSNTKKEELDLPDTEKGLQISSTKKEGPTYATRSKKAVSFITRDENPKFYFQS